MRTLCRVLLCKKIEPLKHTIFVRKKLHFDIVAKGGIAAVCESRHSRVLSSILESDKRTYGSLQQDAQKFNNLVRYWHKLHQQGQFARVHTALFPNEDQDQQTHTTQPPSNAESDGSSDINNSDSGRSDSDSSSKNSPEQPRRNLLSSSNSSQRIPKTRTPILCYPDEEGSYETIKVSKRMEKITINQAAVFIRDFCLTQPIMYKAWLSEDQMGVFIHSPTQPFFLTEDIDRLCMVGMEASKKEGKMVPRYQKTYENFEVYRTRIKAPTFVCYYKFPDGITCTNQFFNGAKDSISSSLKLKQHFGVSHIEFSRSNQQVLPFVRYEMAVKYNIVDIQVEASVDEDIEDCIEQWAQKEHGCEDERPTAWVKKAKRRSEDAEFYWDKLKSEGFELAEHSKRDGKNKHSLKVKESQMKAQEVAIYSDGVNVSTIPAGGGIDVRVKAGSIFQFDGRERVYPDYVVPSTLAPQEHRITPCKLQHTTVPRCLAKTVTRLFVKLDNLFIFRGMAKSMKTIIPNQDDHDHVSHLVSAICHQIPIAEYPPMPPPTHLPQLQSPVPRLHLQSPKGADFPANN
eukprot:jgi/Psemu1/40157/gm1.40157_g